MKKLFAMHPKRFVLAPRHPKAFLSGPLLTLMVALRKGTWKKGYVGIADCETAQSLAPRDADIRKVLTVGLRNRCSN